MNQLGRALGMTLKYRWSLTGSLVCSLAVALLWGANLGAVYPFVEVVLQNKTLHQWADDRIAQSNARIDSHQEAIDQLRESIKPVDGAKLESPTETEITSARHEIRSLQYAISSEELRLESSKGWAPLIKRYAPNDPFRTLVWLMGFMFVGTVLRCLALLANMVLTDRVAKRTVLDMQNEVFSNVLNLEMSELTADEEDVGQAKSDSQHPAPPKSTYDSSLAVKGTGDLISRVRGETKSIGLAITTLFGKTVREPLKMAACLAGAAWVNWRLLLLSMLICPLAGYLMVVLAKVTKRASRKSIEESANMLDRLYQALTYQRVVKAFTMEDVERQRFEGIAQQVYRKSMRITWFGALSRVNNELVGISMITLSVLAGGYLALTQQTHLFGIRMTVHPMDFGSVMMFFGFLIGIADPLRKLGDVYNWIQTGVVAANRVFPLIDRQSKIADPENPIAVPDGQLTVEFENVRFEYEPGVPILHGVDLAIPAGSSLAIVGHNGCGKSTLINMLPRFLDPCMIGKDDAGCVRLGGFDIRNFTLKDLRQHIGYVTQQTMLFNDTIANNIAYGSPNATEQEILAAAKKAHADKFINTLELGLETVVGEHGSRLSGGQRQRLSLARAILKDPEVLILDEATSQIDPESEQLIHQTLAEFMKNRTTIVITHRMSTLDLVDQILMMKDGHVLDCGTHEQLLAQSPDYRRLRNLAMEGAA